MLSGPCPDLAEFVGTDSAPFAGFTDSRKHFKHSPALVNRTESHHQHARHLANFGGSYRAGTQFRSHTLRDMGPLSPKRAWCSFDHRCECTT